MYTSRRDRRAARVEAEALRHLARLDPGAVASAVAGFDHAPVPPRPPAHGLSAAVPPLGPALDPSPQLLHEARCQAAALGLPEALLEARREYRLLLGAGGLAAAFTGAGLVAAAGLVTGGGRLNVYAVLIVLVGLNALGLVAWLGSLALESRFATRTLARAGSSGRVAESWLRRLGFTPTALAARLAWLDARLGPALQPWAGAALFHAFWLLALLAAVLVLGLRLTVEQVDFIWETTLLARPHFEWLTTTLGGLPARVGFPIPDAEQIALTAGGLGVPADHPAAVAARRAWAGWLIGCTLIYGALPRALALLFCLFRQGLREDRLDLPPLAHPFWLHRLQQLERRRAASAQATFPAHPAADNDPTLGPSPPPAGDFTGPGGWVVGLELDTWPPAVPAGWLLTGNAASDAPPAVVLPASPTTDLPAGARLVVLASLVRAPDRGITRWLGEVPGAWPGRVELALTDGERALRRLGDAAALNQRAADWARAARAAGLTHCWWVSGQGPNARTGDSPQ